MTLRRRHWLALALSPALPATATPEAMEAAVKAFVGSGSLRSGRITLDIAPLVENGNSVPVTLAVDSPMSAADHVTALALFNERNPQREVIVAHFTPANGLAQLATRIRLATSQTLTAVARASDGSFWSRDVEVIVTLAACIES